MMAMLGVEFRKFLSKPFFVFEINVRVKEQRSQKEPSSSWLQYLVFLFFAFPFNLYVYFIMGFFCFFIGFAFALFVVRI